MTGIALLAYPGIAEWIISLLFPLWFITTASRGWPTPP